MRSLLGFLLVFVGGALLTGCVAWVSSTNGALDGLAVFAVGAYGIGAGVNALEREDSPW